MAEQKKITKALEEKVQHIAGDIYVQIEDKILDLLVSNNLSENVEQQDISEHPKFKELCAAKQEIETKLADAEKAHQAIEHQSTEQAAKLEQELKDLQKSLNNAQALAESQNKDSEEVVKEKIAAVTELEAKLTDLTQVNEANLQTLEQLNGEVNEKNKIISQLTEKEQSLIKSDQGKAASIAAQNHQISELTAKFNDVNAELAHLKTIQSDKMTESTQLLNQLKTEAKNLAKEKDVLASQKSELEGKLQASNNELNKSQQAHKKVVDELNTEKETNKLLTQQQSESAQTHQEQQSKKQELLKSAEQQNEQYESSITGLNKTIAGLHERIEQLNDDKKALNSTLDDVEQKLDDKNKSYAILQKEHSGDTNKLSELALKKQQAEQANQQLSGDFEALKQQYDNLLVKLDGTEESAHKQKLQLEKVEIDYSESTKKLSELQKDNAVLQQEKSSHVKAIENQQEAIDKANENNHQLSADIEKVKAENKQAVADFEKELAELKAQFQSSQLSVSQLESEVANQKQLLEESGEENKRYQKQSEHLKEQVESLKEEAISREQRFETGREKQEIEYNKARETIKYLRDENNDLNTKLEQQVTELQDKLTEYRLRFEYAQKELAKQ